MSKLIQLSEQQHHIVQAVRSIGKATAREVGDELIHLNLAPSTIATVLTRLEKKGCLRSEVIGRERRFQCLLEEKVIQKSVVASLISTFFKGDSKALLTHLVSEGEIDLDEVEELKNRLGKK